MKERWFTSRSRAASRRQEKYVIASVRHDRHGGPLKALITSGCTGRLEGISTMASYRIESHRICAFLVWLLLAASIDLQAQVTGDPPLDPKTDAPNQPA